MGVEEGPPGRRAPRPSTLRTSIHVPAPRGARSPRPACPWGLGRPSPVSAAIPDLWKELGGSFPRGLCLRRAERPQNGVKKWPLGGPSRPRSRAQPLSLRKKVSSDCTENTAKRVPFRAGLADQIRQNQRESFFHSPRMPLASKGDDARSKPNSGRARPLLDGWRAPRGAAQTPLRQQPGRRPAVHWPAMAACGSLRLARCGETVLFKTTACREPAAGA